MPHFEAKRLIILKEKDVPEGFTLEGIYEAMKDKQFPIKFRKGAVSYEIGMVITAVLGRDAIVGDLGLDPEFKLIVEKKTIAVEVDGDEEVDSLEVTVVKHLEWTT